MSAGSRMISSALAGFGCGAVWPSAIWRLVSGISGAGAPYLLKDAYTTFVRSIGTRTPIGVIRQDFALCGRLGALVYRIVQFCFRKAQFNLRIPEQFQATHNYT